MIHPRLAFRIEAVIFTLAGLSYLLFPGFNSHLVFGDRLLRSAEPVAHCMMMALGGSCILLGCTFCTASETATQNMCLSVAAGHLLNAGLKIFSFISGWSGDVKRGAVSATMPALSALITHVILACLLWLSSTHPAAKKAPLHGSILTPETKSSIMGGREHATSTIKEH